MLYSDIKESNTKLTKELYDTAKNVIFDFNAIKIIKSNRSVFKIVYLKNKKKKNNY
jgi:hypothetical protein